MTGILDIKLNYKSWSYPYASELPGKDAKSKLLSRLKPSAVNVQNSYVYGKALSPSSRAFLRHAVPSSPDSASGGSKARSAYSFTHHCFCNSSSCYSSKCQTWHIFRIICVIHVFRVVRVFHVVFIVLVVLVGLVDLFPRVVLSPFSTLFSFAPPRHLLTVLLCFKLLLRMFRFFNCVPAMQDSF